MYINYVSCHLIWCYVSYLHFHWCSQIIEYCDTRLGDDVEELIQMVEEVFPVPSTEPVNEETKTKAAESTENKGDNEEQIDMDQ